MVTYRVVECRLTNDDNVEKVIHAFKGDDTFELADAVDALSDASECPCYAEVLGDDGKWHRVALANTNFDE